MSQNARPYISLVAVGRNDGYGGDFLKRLGTFVRCFSACCADHRLLSEVVLVEWNPPPDRPALADAIPWHALTGNWCSIKIVTLPVKIHTQLTNAAAMPLLEYMGKNVGIRRCSGEFVLATNPDVILSASLVRFLARKRLSKGSFYRIDRCDVHPVPDDDVDAQLRYCENHLLRIHTREGSFEPDALVRPPQRRFSLKRLFPVRDTRPHLNGSGDFLLLGRRGWAELRGFPELEKFGKSHHIDALLVYQALRSGYRQVIIEEPARLYHQDHSRPDTQKIGSPAVEAALQDFRTQPGGRVFNDDDWGLRDYDLPVVQVKG
jgi:hypothetical protein